VRKTYVENRKADATGRVSRVGLEMEGDTPMTAVTHDLRIAAATRPSKACRPAKKGFFARVLDAMIESRMRQVEREIRMYTHLVPEDRLAKAGIRATLKNDKELPFVK
jgi:hypothetical protein